jgi:hypothetical protein
MSIYDILDNTKNIIFIIIGIIIIYMIFSYYFKSAVTLTSKYNAERKQVIISSMIPSNITSNYTYSLWFYVNDWNYKFGKEKILLQRQSDVNYFPKISLGNIENDILVNIACFKNSQNNVAEYVNHRCNVTNVPLQKWVNLIITTHGRTLDIYIQGKLVKTCVLPGVPYTDNEQDIYVTPEGGFRGYTAKYQYLGNSINPQQAYDIYKSGYGGSIFGDLFNKYKVKISYLKDNEERGSIEI